MKIAFVGKGGSGKSTVTWLIANFLVDQNKSVLAIDSDYNLDLLHNFNLNEKDVPNFINTAEKDFYRYLELSEKDYYVDLPSKVNLKKFKISPPDKFTDKYSFLLKENPKIRLMASGMVPSEMLYGHRCGHAYISSLKYYLPLVECNSNEHVVIDSVAGNDLVSYGMFLGCDAIVVVVEETTHSVGVFEQINNVAKTFSIPTFVVINKYRETNKIKEFIEKNKNIILGKISFDENILDCDYSKISSGVKNNLQEIINNLKKQSFSEELQWKRHKDWYKNYKNQLKENENKDFQFLKTDE
jgi:CO dehydrogenase maturation factor